MRYRHETNVTQIAVTGMAGRFPGAPDVDTFWTNLRAGVESITCLSDEDLRAEGVPVDLLACPEYVRAASVIDGIDQFDAEFFGISAREAALLDPQHRLFLETSWHALENAGRGPGTDRDVGVFAGANMPAYLMSNLLGGNRIVTSPAVFELQIHNDKDYLASRTAFLLGLTGPAVTVQAACASSLVAVHQAARALQTGDCGTALAGGVCVRVPHRVGYLYEKGLIYSPDGHCRPFDADAGGTVFGNGVGVVVLRRLADAIADGDEVLAVLRVTAMNNDGNDKVGYTAPSVAGQQRLISAALAAAEFEASSITALEAHGTGTQVGDPIEITALSRAFAEHTDERGFCAVSSVKSNIGHLETAAGVASMIKAVQQLRHRELAPSLHFRRPNPRIDFDSSPFHVAAELTPWSNGTQPRRIGVSSFGIGGSNAHVILEEPPSQPATTTDTRQSQILVLSARSRRALDQATQDLARHLETVAAQGDRPALAQLATSSQLGRAPQRFRRALVARNLTEASALLGGAEPARVPSSVAPPAAPKLLFLFPGQGTQYPGMGRDLYTNEPVYRDVVDECAEVLAPLLNIDLRTALYPEPGADPDSAAHRLEQTSLAQPALFVTEYALARQLAAWGIVPDAMVGHSLGEFVAACLAGVFGLHDVLRLVAARGAMMQRLPAGGMMSVAAAEDDLADLLCAELSIAAVNAPSMCVVSGPIPALDALRERLDGQDVPSRPLHTSHAFHSAMIDPIVPAFTDLVSRTELGPPGQAVLSTVTGRWINEEQATDPTYWGSHMRRPVRFGDAVRAVVDALGRSVLLEVGPGNTLSTLSRHAIEPSSRTTAVSGMRRADHQESDVDLLLGAVAGLWLSGVEIDWARLQPSTGRTRLPTYPFQHKRYWIEPRLTQSGELVVDTPAVAEETDEGVAGSRPEHLLTSYAEPRTGLGYEVARVWEDSFGFSPIGLHDNFFELGGHSLMATQMLNRLSAKVGRVATLGQLLANPTVAALAGLLDEQEPAGPGGGLPQLVPQPDRRCETFPLTEMQQAQWLGRLGSFDMGGVAPHLYLEFDSSTLDRHRLEEAWRQVVRRHEMLRIIVLPDGRQRVLDEVPEYRFAELDLRGVDPAQAREQLAELSERMAMEVRPADEWPLWEIRVTRLADGTLRTHISFDLLCADVASFFYQVLPAWRDFYAEPARPSHPAELSFRDYVLAEEALRETSRYERSLEYWRGRVRELPAAPELPTVRVAAEIARPTFVRRHATVPPDIWARIKERAGEHGVTPSSVLVAAYSATVARWSRSQHFTLNFTAVNRLPFHPDVDDVVGEFASFELLEVDARELGTFHELVEQVQRQSWADFEHRHVSGVRILRELNRVRRDTTGGVMPVVFTSALSTEQDPASVPSPVNWLGEQVRFISQTPQVSIDHFVLEFGGVLELAWHAVDELFPDGLMAEMFAAYQELLFSLVDEQGWQRPPSAHPPPWQERMRACANATAGPVPTELLCTGVLAAGSEPRTADLPAVITAERTLSHRELSGRAVMLAGELAASGRSRGSVIGVGLDKGWRQVVAAVGASAAGCTYVPIDPDLPLARRAWLIEHAGVDSVLVDPADAHEWPPGVQTVAVPDEVDWQRIAVADWVCPAKVEDIAYAIYTSGSTGTPKGVAVCHTAVLNTLDDVRERFGITEQDRVAVRRRLGPPSRVVALVLCPVVGTCSSA